MGNSLHNKIYLGRRHPLINMKRIQVAACVSAATGVAAILLVVAALK